MRLHELDKNSKYGYRRRSWDIRYIGFDGADWKIVHPNGVTESLISANLEAMDWILSDLPNMYYKRVAIVTKDVNGHPVGARIVLGRSSSKKDWVLEDGTSDREWHHVIGDSCEWEDEMKSPFPCFRRSKAHKHIVMFTSYKSGSVVKEGNLYLGGEEEESSGWAGYDDTSIWEPCEDPRSQEFWAMEPEFPCFRKWRTSTLVVKFMAPKTGTVIVRSSGWALGDYSCEWVRYDDCEWEPCEDPCKRKFKVGDKIRYKRSSIHTIAFIEDDRYRLEGNSYTLFTDEDAWGLVSTAIQPSPKPEDPENLSCSSESIPTQQKENKMDLRLLLAMMAAMSNEETPKDATNSKHVVIVTKDDAYEGYFYSDDLDAIKDIVAEPKNELKKFHVFDYSTTLAQKPRKVVEVVRS